MRTRWAVAAVAVVTLTVVLARSCAVDAPAPTGLAAAAPGSEQASASRTRSRGADVTDTGGAASPPGRAATPPAAANAIALVRVVGADKAPVAGAHVDLHRVVQGTNGREVPIAETGVTAADGTVRFAVPRAEYFARVRSGELLGSSDASWVPQLAGVPETTLQVTLRPTVLHRGRVTAVGSGDPVPGARVHAHDGGLSRQTTTDADGRFEFTGVTHSHDPYVRAEAPGYVDEGRKHTVVDARTVTWEITLHPANVVRGVLRGPDGPVRQAGEAWLLTMSDGQESGGVALGIDAEGRFEATFRGAGSLALHVAGYAPARLPIQVNGRDVLDAGIIELRPGLVLKGRVLDRQGAPVPRVAVGVRCLETGIGVGRAWTDADGRFEISGLGAGEHQVDTREAVDAPLAGGRPDTSRRGVFGGTELTIEQPEGNAVLVRLRDAAGVQLVVRDVQVKVRRPPDADWWSGIVGSNVHTIRVHSREPRKCDLRIEAAGYEPTEVLDVDFPEGRAAPLDVRLTPKPK